MSSKRKIKVLIIDDSSLVREILSAGLKQDPDLEVVGAAQDPFQAREMIIKFRPDVLTLDIEMPRMNGLEFLARLMPQFPLPVIMVSSLTQKGAKETFRALELGAIDFIPKPDGGNPNDLTEMLTELSTKIKIASTVNVSKYKKSFTNIGKNDINKTFNSSKIYEDDIIAIGASTGGIEAILELVKNLPTNLPGIVITQHMPKGFTKSFAERLNSQSLVLVEEAYEGAVIKNGTAYIAPGDFHMEVVKANNKGIIKLNQKDKVSGHRPSVDVLFNSVAKSYSDQALGVILTGMGKDGAVGMKAMKDSGSFTLGQDEETSIVYGMPFEAFKIGAVQEQLPLQQISQRIMKHYSR